MSMLVEHSVLPPATEEPSGLQVLIDVLSGRDAVALVGADAVAHDLPDEVRQVLTQAVRAMADGHAVTVASRGTVLTTKNAADVLGVSRPTLVRLLEAGEIPFTKPVRHRRVLLEDVLAYQQRLREVRRNELAAMAAEAAEDDSYRTVHSFVRTR